MKHTYQTKNQYAERDIEALDESGNYYMVHLDAMTIENLYSKSSIAAELAFRDARIAELEAALSNAETIKGKAQEKRDLELKASGIYDAISETRMTLVDGGQRWLCKVEDLGAYSERLFKQAGELQ